MKEELNINIPTGTIIFKGELPNGKTYLVEMEILDKDLSNFNASNYIFHRVLVWEVDKSITFKPE
jgi:hypothetical protein